MDIVLIFRLALRPLDQDVSLILDALVSLCIVVCLCTTDTTCQLDSHSHIGGAVWPWYR